MSPNESDRQSVYAPVIIPTLCRYGHFRDCLESLMACTGADMTDVYVGLDYPANESHAGGWRQIGSWLESIRDSHPFRSLTVIRRGRNYGIGPDGNLISLLLEILRHHDRVIVTEDDNVFSPAFLEYVNKGLEKFKDDQSVLAINGYRHFYDVRFDDNTFYMQNVDFSAWGYGIWRDRIEKTIEASQTAYWRRKALSPLVWWRVYVNGWNRIMDFRQLIAHTASLNDNGLSVYMAINRMNVVMPRESMVRNMGWDGSGVNCDDATSGAASKYAVQQISDKTSFNYAGTGREHYRENHAAYVRQSYGRISFGQFVRMAITKVRLELGRLCGNNS